MILPRNATAHLAFVMSFFTAPAIVMAADESLPERAMHPGNSLEQSGSIGVTVLPEAGILRVTRVFPGGPAERASMRPDDRIIQIDGKNLADLDVRDRIELLRGKIGSKVTLLLQRGQPGHEVRVSLDRAPLAQWLTPKP